MLLEGSKTTDSFELVRLVLEELQVKTNSLILPVSRMGEFPDLGLRAHLFGEKTAFCEKLPSVMFSPEERGKVYLLRDQFYCRYFLSTDQQSQGHCRLTGPYLMAEPTMRDITTLCKKLNLPATVVDFLRTYYKMLPKLKDQNLIEALFRTYSALQYGQGGFEMVPWEMDAGDSPAFAGQVWEGSINLREFLDRTYLTEKKLLECVSQGNYSGALSTFTRLQGNGVEARTDSTLRDGKNSVIVLNTLCRVAAYAGGAHPYDIDKWTREFIIRIESAVKLQDIQPLSRIILKKYCELVRSAEGTQYSPVIRKAVDSISGSFAPGITLKELAAQLCISPSYLSILFKKETGKTFTEFVTEKRIGFAMQLLTQTNLPINTVAVECGIPDNNYFARLFKAQTGMTPLAYRQKQM